MLAFVFATCAVALLAAAYFAWDVLKTDTGTPEMRKIANAIHTGAQAFLDRQNRTISLLFLITAGGIFSLYALLGRETKEGIDAAFSFLLGSATSLLAGFIGMHVSIRTNIRVASAARRGLPEALRLALRGGAVSGIAVVALSLLGVGGLFWFMGGAFDPTRVPLRIVGFGFGASFVALFAQVGGGIYTKAADVGADLVGKIEAGIPEDDPRNPAVIADLVGDNVGDCAGRGADLFESTAAENIGAMVLGAALYPVFGLSGVLFPLVARATGLLAAIGGVLSVRLRGEQEDPMKALNRGYLVTSVLAGVGFYLSVRYLLKDNFWLLGAGLIGLTASYVFVWITQYYTESKYRPVKDIARSSLTGHATLIISGLAYGLESTALPILTIALALVGSYFCGVRGLAGTGIETMSAGLYGTAIATMGMLSTCAYVLSMDTFGPITDNAGGIVEMSGQPDSIRRKTDRLDAVGNTTKALTKGYAVGSAALAAFLLFSAYMDEVSHLTGKAFRSVDLAKVEVFVGAMLGAMLVFLFSALAIRAVGKAAYAVINEVRAQFSERPGILQGTQEPDYARCVDLVTAAALKQMVWPGVLVVGTPVAVGLIFKLFGLGAETAAGFLMVGTITGILLALFMNNAGGAWDNAKKFVETNAIYGGKGSLAHQAAVVGDTVGDPLKDTAGPSLHVLIKLLATITLVFAPLFV